MIRQKSAECESVKNVLSATLVIAPALRSDRNTDILTPNPVSAEIWRQNSSEYLPPWHVDVPLMKRWSHIAFAEKRDRLAV